MTRRILLIDADPTFRAQLTQQLARYRFEIVTEPDADAAIELGSANPPALLIVAVEEPEKAGFKVFQRCKRGALTKVPIALVTSSVTPSSFAKHRGLKVHADDYLDKRELGDDELLARLDQLIGLGELAPAADALDSALEVEVDDIALSGDDMVLEETVGEDDGDGGVGDAALVGGLDEPGVDSMVDAETDAAFAALLGGDELGGALDGALDDGGEPAAASAHDEPALELAGEPGDHVHIDAGVHAADRDEDEDAAVPSIIQDSGRHLDSSGGVEFDSFSRESMRPPVDLIARVRAEHRERAGSQAEPEIAISDPAQHEHAYEHEHAHALDSVQPGNLGVPERAEESVASIPIDVDDLEQIEDDPGVILEIDQDDAHTGAVTDGHVAGDDDDAAAIEAAEQAAAEAIAAEAAEQAAAEAIAAEAAEQAAAEAIAAEAAEQAAAEQADQAAAEAASAEQAAAEAAAAEQAAAPAPRKRPRFIEASTVVETGLQAVAGLPTGAAPVYTPPTPPAPAAAVTDLGLDEIAPVETTSEHSGVYDRRALRKIGELERQVAQLKTELDRSRASADASARGGREREFLNLREQLIARDKELHQTRDDLRARDRELGETQDHLRAADHARTTAEARASDLEQRVALDAGRLSSFDNRDRAFTGQITALQHEIESRVGAYATAESARVQLERELAAERALRAAHASDAERALRVEREQLIARHQGDLAATRNDAAGQRDAAIAAIRDELALDHAEAIAHAAQVGKAEAMAAAERVAGDRNAQHDEDLEQLRAEHAEAVAQHAAQVGQLIGERDAAMAQIASERDAAVTATEDEHHAIVARLQGERAAELAQAREDAALQLAHVRDQLAADIQFAKQEAETRVAAITTAKDRAVAELVGELERTKHALATERADHEESLGIAAADQAAALEDLANQHAEDLVRRQQEHASARAIDADAHDTVLAELKAELDRQAAHHGISLDTVRKELEDKIEQHELSRGQLVEQHRAQADELTHHHADELARIHADRQRALDDSHAAAAALRAGAEQAAADHRAELTQHAELAAREVAEHRSALLGVKRAMEEAAARHHAERDTANRTAAKTLEDQIAQHERASALANGEIVRVKAVADAEHAKTMAQLQAEHDRQRKDQQAEHDRQRREAALDGERQRRELIADHDRQRKELVTEHTRVTGELTTERDELRRGLSGARDNARRSETELASAVQTIADRNAELRAHAAAIAERDQRLAELRGEIDGLEQENANYQEQVLRAYQKIKSDEAMVARAKKAMAIALTVLDDQGTPKSEPT